jgi:hypothetical protein
MGRRLGHVTLLAMVAALCLASTAQAHHKPRFQLFGTAEHAKDPTDQANHVIEITTSIAGAFGGVTRDLNQKITTLDDHLSVSYYFVSPLTCFGGSPRIQLRFDSNGDGIGDGNLFGHFGPSPVFTGCLTNLWQHEDLTLSTLENAPQTICRWDSSQIVGGTQCNTWDGMKAMLSTMFPNHRVLRGQLVADAFAPVMEGVAFYDEITIGYRTLYDASDTIGN